VTVTEVAPRLRHPLDPDVTRSSKAMLVLALGIVGAVTGALVGGVIPATIALIMARATRAELVEARGYLTGGRMLRAGVLLAWVGILLAATALVVAAIFGLLHLAADASTPQHFAPGTN
jgi:(hydroxyamino)benzene mutase